MTAFLFIPSTSDARLARRVDFANIASLFAEGEEPAGPSRSRRLSQIVAAVLIAVIAIGDAVLVTRPDALSSLSIGSRHTVTGPARQVSL